MKKFGMGEVASLAIVYCEPHKKEFQWDHFYDDDRPNCPFCGLATRSRHETRGTKNLPVVLRRDKVPGTTEVIPVESGTWRKNWHYLEEAGLLRGFVYECSQCRSEECLYKPTPSEDQDGEEFPGSKRLVCGACHQWTDFVLVAEVLLKAP